ncbi:MAG: FAD-binding oxidoreductase [Bacteroidota bacterium]
MQVSNWGKYPVVDVPVRNFRTGDKLNELPAGSWIPRGMGRCYGDSALGEQIISTQEMKRFLAFDSRTGVLHCESGVTYEDILEHFVPQGWFPPVTPGTKFVSMGGALASDVHGKNHHVDGSFLDHILEFDLLTPKGEFVTCSPTHNRSLYLATAGGMGLTGLVTSLKIQLKPIETSAIKFQNIKAKNLDEILELIEQFESATYSVAWIDVLSRGKNLGRSILMKGEHATLADVKGSKWEPQPLQVPQKFKFSVPFDFPSFALNNFTIKAFNELFYRKQLKKEVSGLTDYDGYFYPLDVIHHWNRIYGRRGFTQYQFVLPKAQGAKGMREILETIVEARFGSFLSVLKAFGPQGDGLLSFPLGGYTLTLDFPISPRLFPFLERLDELVLVYGGRVYLTKDVRLTGETLAKMYPRLPEFREVIESVNPDGQVKSLQSERLGLHRSQAVTS